MTTPRFAAALFLCAGSAASAQEKLHYSYLWHLEQPIYWPDRQTTGNDRYECAWESMQRAGTHPANNLADIFGLADRVAAYQGRVRDSVQSMLGFPEAGVQITYSGGLIENISSLGNANQLGYSPTWYGAIRQARGWTTAAGGKPRCDVVLFSFHHALLPLCDDATVRKEIELYKSVYADAWGSAPAISRGFFPSEMAFSTRLIKALADEGITWCIVSGEKVSRACNDFPVILGSGGVNCDPPNAADKLNPAQTNYYRLSISRGCAPAEAYPFAFTPHRAQYVDPNTGTASTIIVVPASQSLGWKDGYAPLGTSDFDALQTRNDPSRPMLVLLAHDGDNAWGGGYSYYMEATPNLVNSAAAAGYVPTVVEKYLADHPVPASDIVHVEDGAWVNADGDFGAPQFINWNWPLLSATGQIDIANGWHEDPRNWAVITAAQNRVETAEQISTSQGSPVNIRHVLYPDASATNAERGWHYFLGSLNSGYMYYGTSLDLEVKPTIACNEAVRNTDPVIASGTDQTPPTIWLPQRSPWNPGSTNFGPEFGYQQVQNNGDFYVWTFAYDVSGLSSVTLKYRLDADGQRSLANTENETYAGGPGVGAWQLVPMTRRVFPAGNVYNNPSIDFFEMPQYIADEYYTQVTSIRSKLVDYYVEATDTHGLTKKSPIQHVWVGAGTGGGGGGGSVVAVAPSPPVAGQNVTITYDPSGRPLAAAPQVYLHYGFNTWNPVITPDPAMTLVSSKWQITVPVPSTATQLDMVFNNGSGTWDNNSSADWHFSVQGGSPGQNWTIDGTRDADSTLIATNGSHHLWAGLKGDNLYIATESAAGGNDQFIFLANPPGALTASPWAKSGQAAAWDYFLADELDNSFTGWFNAAGTQTTANVQNASGAGGGVLEGTINLRAVYGGVLPSTVYLAAAPYANPNGGALQPALQIPAGNGNTTLDAAEYIRVDLCQFYPGGCIQPCYANCDGSTTIPVLNANDFQCFLNAFALGDTYANCDASTVAPVLNANDFQCFLNAFASGCS